MARHSPPPSPLPTTAANHHHLHPQALDQLVRQQTITCTFDAFAKAFPTSAPVLAISSTRSLLREAFATVLPLQPAAQPPQPGVQQLGAQQLDLVRDYLMAAQVGRGAAGAAGQLAGRPLEAGQPLRAA
jgi:hypothetical protein